MLTSLHIENFKAWKDTGKIRLAPLTVIFGTNSSGKSSIGHLLLALKQTVLSTDRKQVLNLGNAHALIELGSYHDCLYNHDLNNELRFQIAWDLPEKLEVTDSETDKRFSGNSLALSVIINANKNNQAKVKAFKYDLFNDNGSVLAVKFFDKFETIGVYDLLSLSEQFQFVKKSDTSMSKSWAPSSPDKFYRVSNFTRTIFLNADFLDDFALQTENIFNNLDYLGPLSEPPKRTYSWSGETEESVGQKGEFSIAAILSAVRDDWRYQYKDTQQDYRLDELIAYWLKDLGLIHSFRLSPIAEGRKEYEVLIRTHVNASEVKITDVGFGISQVLPVLVQAFYAPANSTVWIEQPELHLHPQVQSELADVFLSAIKTKQNGLLRNVQFIIESHSEHFLNRLQRRIAEGSVSPEDVAIYFCKRSGSEAELEALRVNQDGDIENWPENFFGDEMADIAGRSIAAMQRKKAQSQ